MKLNKIKRWWYLCIVPLFVKRYRVTARRKQILLQVLSIYFLRFLDQKGLCSAIDLLFERNKITRVEAQEIQYLLDYYYTTLYNKNIFKSFYFTDGAYYVWSRYDSKERYNFINEILCLNGYRLEVPSYEDLKENPAHYVDKYL